MIAPTGTIFSKAKVLQLIPEWSPAKPLPLAFHVSKLFACDVQLLLIKRMDRSNEANNPFTGLACIGDHTLAVTSATHTAILQLIPEWSPGKPWPRAFLRAAQTTLLISKFGEAHATAESQAQHIATHAEAVSQGQHAEVHTKAEACGHHVVAHANAESGSKLGLWSLPREILNLILWKASAPHSAWLEEQSSDGASFYGIPVAALTSTMIQEPLVRLYLSGAWAFDPQQQLSSETEAEGRDPDDWSMH
jgi:hypothetical protein